MSAIVATAYPSLSTAPSTPSSKSSASQSGPAASAAAPANDSFLHDVLEIINPLQHIPIVSTIYRELTGDKINPIERIAGDTLYGGAIGFVSSIANLVFEQVTGKDFGDTALAMLGVGGDKSTALAANDTAAQPTISRVATAAPAQLTPVAAKTMPSSSVQTKPANVTNSGVPANSPTRGGGGLDLVGSTSRLPVTTDQTSALDDKTSNASLASLGRTGPDPVSAALPTPAPATTPPVVAADSSAVSDENATALMTSLHRDGVETDMGLRAMYAYRKTLGLPTSFASTDATQH
ncbi:MAG: hypothetical protein ABSC92_07990 [Rhizomicrobium sp.]|jgi:hypothetical protein